MKQTSLQDLKTRVFRVVMGYLRIQQMSTYKRDDCHDLMPFPEIVDVEDSDSPKLQRLSRVTCTGTYVDEISFQNLEFLTAIGIDTRE